MAWEGELALSLSLILEVSNSPGPRSHFVSCHSAPSSGHGRDSGVLL